MQFRLATRSFKYCVHMNCKSSKEVRARRYFAYVYRMCSLELRINHVTSWVFGGLKHSTMVPVGSDECSSAGQVMVGLAD